MHSDSTVAEDANKTYASHICNITWISPIVTWTFDRLYFIAFKSYVINLESSKLGYKGIYVCS